MAKEKQDQLPAKLEESPYAICKADPERLTDIISLNLGGKTVTAFKLERIRIPDGKSDFWTVPTPEGSDAKKIVEGIVVHKKDMRAWWPDLDPSGKPPMCKSDDARQGLGCRTVGEHFPNDPADKLHDCETCKFSQFESDPKGGKGQWCKEMRAIFLLREDTFLPTVMFLPPTSLGPFDDYLLRLATYGIPYNSVVIKFGLEKEKNAKGDAYNKVSLTQSRRLSDEEYERVKSYTAQIKPALEKVKVDEDAYSTEENTVTSGGG